ncbi:MAG: hypothetical protein V7L31_16910, partial [Nostoc sp.]
CLAFSIFTAPQIPDRKLPNLLSYHRKLLQEFSCAVMPDQAGGVGVAGGENCDRVIVCCVLKVNRHWGKSF